MENLSEKILNKILGKGKTTEDIIKDMVSNDSKCVICGGEYHGYGHNAEPVKKGYCCTDCNLKKVIPARMRGG